MNPVSSSITTSIAVFAPVAGVGFAGNPAVAIAEGRQHIQNCKFITEEGYGESVLQRDFFALKALGDAGQM